jgi:hypothetical protein
MTRGEDPSRDGQVDRVDRRSEHLDRLARRLVGVADIGSSADLVDQSGFQRALTIGTVPSR